MTTIMKIIDLTMSIHNGMFVYPSTPEVNIKQLLTMDKDGWNMKRIHINGHDGTHVNAPIHCTKNGKTLDDYDVSDFCGECVLHEIDSDIKSGMGIIFTKQITMETAKHIVRIRPKFVGLVVEADEKIEQYLLNNGIILFERLANTDKLPKLFLFYGVPLKIKDGDGSPVRAFAVLS
jgi:kynurenine formamidase